MQVEADDLAAAAAQYARMLEELAGTPPVLDLIHLGLGPDGHTASLVPGDTVLEVTGTPVALTGGLYQGCRRMTLTYPVLDGARAVLWLVTGAEKVDALRRLRRRDRTIPAGRVRQDDAVVIADRAAEAGIEEG
jgi:6-phosphogluconolactonase